MQIIKKEVFEEFKRYARRMLNDIATAHTGPYHNNTGLQEIAVVWNPAEKPLKGYPMPENITHIRTEPYPSGMEISNYLFKEVLCELLECCFYMRTERDFISEMDGKKEFSCNIYHGGTEDFKDTIDALFIRCNGDLGEALQYIREIDDAGLDSLCQVSMWEFGMMPESKKDACPVPVL